MNEMTTYQSNSPAVQGAGGATTAMVASRQAQEVQMAMYVAKTFPRDIQASTARIINACRRKDLAEQAMYEFPRGDQSVTGPSIRLAEALAQNWGNLDFGITELEQKNGESTVMAFCWDLETNTRQTKIFTVPHIRQTKKGSYALTDPRDIYEMVANQGARRLRACILGIIPGDIVDAAIAACNDTLTKGQEELQKRIGNVIYNFQNRFNVPQECLEQYVGCNAEAFTEQTLVRLRGVFTALKEGRSKVEDYFTLPVAAIEQGEQEPALPDPFAFPEADGETGEVVSMDDL